jgi:hypothetical protein
MHRDVKPSNILIRDADGIIKIFDFGVAKNLQECGLGEARTFAGTLPYMSPEVIRLKRRGYRVSSTGVDYRTDIYSLGVTMYQMATGKYPYNPDRDGEDVILDGNPIPPHDVTTGVPRDLSAIILKAMACDREDRYQTADELYKALCDWQAKGLNDLIEQAWQCARRGEGARAEQLFREAVAKFPQHPWGYVQLARFYNQRHRIPEVIPVLEDGLKAVPVQERAELHQDLGMAYYRQQKFSEAKQHLEQAGVQEGSKVWPTLRKLREMNR